MRRVCTFSVHGILLFSVHRENETTSQKALFMGSAIAMDYYDLNVRLSAAYTGDVMTVLDDTD